MSKVIFDFIQRFEVENGLPHLISSSTKVIEGGEDMMSLATSMLEQLSFDKKFKLNHASQYTGYRLKSPGQGAKRYQLVLAQRKEGLCISIPQDVLDPYVLYLSYYIKIAGDHDVYHNTKGIFWVLPSKKDIFLESLNPIYWSLLEGETVGNFYLNDFRDDGYGCGPVIDRIPLDECRPETLSDNDTYLILSEDKLFPYTWQLTISSKEVLEEFISHFAKILMENQ